MHRFIHRPFLYMTPLLCLGIVLADTYSFRPVYTIFFVISLLVLFLLSRSSRIRREVNVAFLGLSVLLLGAAVLEWQRPAKVVRSTEDIVALIEVEEIAETDKDWRRAIVHLQSSYVNGEIIPQDESICVLFNSSRVRQGDILATRLQLIPIQNKGNPGEFNSETFWARQNIFRMAFVSEEDFQFVDFRKEGLLKSFLGDTRDQCKLVLKRNLPKDVVGLAEALLLGDKTKLSAEDRGAFSNAGAMHVLAVSGLHVGIVVYLLMFLFGKMPRILSKNQAHILALLLVWVYAFLTGMSPSVQRAAFMFTLLVLSQVYGRRHDSLNVLFFSAFVLLIIDPLLVYDIGFQLSYLAMLGILTMYRPISRLVFIRWKLLRKIWEGTAVGIAAQICTVPLTLYYFHQFPNYFALSNLAVMLLAALILGAGIALFVFQAAQWVSSLLGAGLGVLLFALLFIMQWIEKLPGAVATGFDPEIYIVILCYLSLLVFGIFRKVRFVRLGMPFVLFALFAFIQYQRFENWNRHELVVFNHRHPIFCVKHADQIWCFFKDREGVEGDAERLVSDYLKIHPGRVKYIPLSEGKTQVEIHSATLECSVVKSSTVVAYGDLSLEIRSGHNNLKDSTKIQLNMAYLPREKGCLSLMDGAYHHQLNSVRSKN